MTFFGLKSSQDLENRAAHPYQEFPGVPPRVSNKNIYAFYIIFTAVKLQILSQLNK